VGNSSKGSYRTTPVNTMNAFDKLPPSARTALANATFCWAVQPVLTRWRLGYQGYRTGPEIAGTVARWDRDAIAKVETKRRRTP